MQVHPTQAPVIVSEPTKPLEPEPEPAEPPKEPTEKLAALLEQRWAPPKKKGK